MIESMTGFGRGAAQVNGVTAVVEMRSVNSRFTEVSVRLPRILAEREQEMQSLVKGALARGRISVQVQVDRVTGETLAVQVDPQAARSYMQLLEQLRSEAGILEPVRLEHLLAFPEVFTNVEDDTVEDDAAWDAVLAAFEEAINGMRAMRRQEGAALQRDLEDRINAIEGDLAAVEERAPERVQQGRERLHDRLQEMLGDERINLERLEFEIAVLADRLDVTEECVRLRSHLVVFREALASDEPAGRKLNFLVQEINREVNTIGSKANDAEMTHRAVQMKEELEKIREQIQNIE